MRPAKQQKRVVALVARWSPWPPDQRWVLFVGTADAPDPRMSLVDEVGASPPRHIGAVGLRRWAGRLLRRYGYRLPYGVALKREE